MMRGIHEWGNDDDNHSDVTHDDNHDGHGDNHDVHNDDYSDGHGGHDVRGVSNDVPYLFLEVSIFLNLDLLFL